MKKLATLIANLEAAGVKPDAILNVIKLHLGEAPAKPKLVAKRKRRTKTDLAALRAQENVA